MIKKIVGFLAVILLCILPFLLAVAISKYSPYVETNRFQTYVILCAVISTAILFIVFFLMKRFYPSMEISRLGDILLFLLLCPLFSIYGLASAPDLSLTMLDHPEREHLRYILLFIALVLFGGYILLLLRSSALAIKKSTRWIMTVIFMLVLAEYFWEFTHHYSYPEAMKEWVSQGNNPVEFGKNYDNFKLVTVGVIGRYLQFISVIWLSLFLFKLQKIKIWCPILNIIFSSVGIFSATFILITKMNIPKGFEILYIFFIPGIPFFLLYWLGVALLTNIGSGNSSVPKRTPTGVL